MTRMERRRRRRRILRIKLATTAAVLALTTASIVALTGGAAETVPEPTPQPPALQAEPVLLTAEHDSTYQPVQMTTEPTQEPEPVEEEDENEKIEAALLEQGYLHEEIPLDFDLQCHLIAVCEEYGVPQNVALGVISPDSAVVTTLDNWNPDDQMIVISGTTAETYLTKEYPDIPLQKYDSYATAKNALENGNGVAWANDNTEVIAFAKQNTGYTVGIPSLGSQDTIAPAVSQGNTTVLDWLNEEIKALGEENFFHKDYEETLVDTYGLDYEDELVVEGGETASSEAADSEAAASEVASSAAAQ